MVTKIEFQKKSPICASFQASTKLSSFHSTGNAQAEAKSSLVDLKAV